MLFSIVGRQPAPPLTQTRHDELAVRGARSDPSAYPVAAQDTSGHLKVRGLPHALSRSDDVHRKELAVRRLAVLPKLLSAFDEHAELLANQPPCGNARSVR